MSYNSSFYLEVEYREKNKLDEIKKYVLKNQNEYQDMIHATGLLLDEGDYMFDYSWYQHDLEIIKLSKVFPKYLFTLRIQGEQRDHIEQNYYVNGKMDYNPMKIPKKSKIEYERLEKLSELEYQRQTNLNDFNHSYKKKKSKIIKAKQITKSYSSIDSNTNKIVYHEYKELKKTEDEIKTELAELEKKRLEILAEKPYITKEEEELYERFYYENEENFILRKFNKKNLKPLEWIYNDEDMEHNKELSLLYQEGELEKEDIEKAKQILKTLL